MNIYAHTSFDIFKAITEEQQHITVPSAVREINVIRHLRRHQAVHPFPQCLISY